MIKFALAVPCHNFIENAFDVFNQHNELSRSTDFETYCMEEVIVTEENVNTIQIDADVIITRGLLAEILKSIQGDIPVVEIQVPATDTLRVVLNCKKEYHASKVGIIASHNMVMGATEISSFLDIPFETYILTTSWNGPQLVDQALKDGCDAIVGGLNTCAYASSINVPNMFITTGRDSFWQSITAAKRAAAISRMEQEKTGRLQVILNTSKEGLLSIDTLKRIRMSNQAAEHILNLKSSPDGQRVMDAPLPREFKKFLLNDEACSNELIKYGETYLNVNKYPIWVQQNNMGIVVSFQEVNDIVNLESHIRRKIHNKGHVAKAHFEDIVGASPIMQKTIETARKYSCTDSNILLFGQSGTGKELFAQSIHNHSARKGGPFVAVNCAAIPEALLESELFGYEAGAFTGAQKNGKPGYFELAHNGTLFLDEIGELPLKLQAKLLRAIQEHEVMRIGSERIISINIRIIAATNRNLEQLTETGSFREDLFYRLDVLHIEIPPLDKRRDDIPLLARHFFSGCTPQLSITDGACEALSRRNWKGNIRQLFNICERLAVLRNGLVITEVQVREVLPDRGDAVATESVNREGIWDIGTGYAGIAGDVASGDRTSERRIGRGGIDRGGIADDRVTEDKVIEDRIIEDRVVSESVVNDSVVENRVVEDHAVNDGVIDNRIAKDIISENRTSENNIYINIRNRSKELFQVNDKGTGKSNNERERILTVLSETHYNRQKAASILQMSRSTLWRKMKMYGL